MNANLENLIPNIDFPDYTVFSSRQNPLYFQYALPILTEYVSNEKVVFVCQKHFEELVGFNKILQEEYVEWYAPGNEFYITTRKDKDQFFDIYILARNMKVLMFFIRKSV